jgi:hypothetical protein
MPSEPVIPRALCGQKLNQNWTVVRRPASRVAAVATAVALALLGGVAGAARAAGPLPPLPTHGGNQRMLIPAYFSPGGPGGPVWADMCDRIRNSLSVSLIIMNPPDSGHLRWLSPSTATGWRPVSCAGSR